MSEEPTSCDPEGCEHRGRHVHACPLPKGKRGPKYCSFASLFAAEARRAGGLACGEDYPHDGEPAIIDIASTGWSFASGD